MKIKIIAVGKNMPSWVTEAYEEYAKRLPKHLAVELIEIPLQKRNSPGDIPRLMTQEGNEMLSHLSKDDFVIATAIQGKNFSTEMLAQKFQEWQMLGRDIAILIGGPEGLAKNCYERADILWSLSALTLPHPIVRIILAEQIYRAYTILSGHPYHK